jgi:riboflavin kinase / FMN adenylyltransferase
VTGQLVLCKGSGMLVLKTKNEVENFKFKDVALTIGSFDGLHLGHRQLIADLLKFSAAKKVVMTFDPHPAKILSQNPPPLLFSQKDQEEVLSALGVDVLFYLPFDQKLANMDAEEFIDRFIWKLFEPKLLVVGYDFSFGKMRRGTFDVLKNKLGPQGVSVIQKPAFRNGEDIVSSTLIRKLLSKGELERVHVLLDRPYYLEGQVIEGKRLGRTLGFPTVNLKCSNEIFPGTGVYFAHTIIDKKVYKAIGNIGLNPTVSVNHNLKIEFHILDFQGELYGKNLRFYFHNKVRDEKRFASVDELKRQIQKDVEVARNLEVNAL